MQIPFANQSTIPADYDSGTVTMTRDEAIAKITPIIADAFPPVPSHRLPAIAASEIDMFVALGILKLDEPKSVEQQVLEIISQHVTAKQMYSIKGAIHNAKLL